MRTSLYRFVGGLALPALLVVGCGDDDDTTGEPGTVTVTAVDYAYEGLPAAVPAGTTFVLENDSDQEIHEFVAFRLADDDDRSIEEIVQLPPDELFPLIGTEPAAVLLAPPGGGDQIAAVGTGTITEPGRYALICVIPTGADPQEYLEAAATSEGPPEVDGGAPHIANGMFAEFIVED